MGVSLGDWAHLGNYIIYDILLEDIANPKSQHICGRTKRDWLKCHDCFILDHIINHRPQTGRWWSNMWANIDKRQGVWGSRLRFKLRTNPSGGVWANKNLGITNRVGVDIWDSGWLENKIYLAQHTSEMAPWEKAMMQRSSQLQELSSPLPLSKLQHLQLATWELLARLLLCWRLYIYYYDADS